jgi:hypothetical protein
VTAFKLGKESSTKVWVVSGDRGPAFRPAVALACEKCARAFAAYLRWNFFPTQVGWCHASDLPPIDAEQYTDGQLALGLFVFWQHLVGWNDGHRPELEHQ